jgi:GntR family transcriptional regulator
VWILQTHKASPGPSGPRRGGRDEPAADVRVADWIGWDTARTKTVITVEPMGEIVCVTLGIPAGAPGFQTVGIALNSHGETVFVTITSAQLHHRITLDTIG